MRWEEGYDGIAFENVVRRDGRRARVYVTNVRYRCNGGVCVAFENVVRRDGRRAEPILCGRPHRNLESLE